MWITYLQTMFKTKKIEIIFEIEHLPTLKTIFIDSCVIIDKTIVEDSLDFFQLQTIEMLDNKLCY